MPYCPICGRTFETKNGLQGHFRFKHRYELKQERPARETPFIRAIGENIERRMSGDAVMKAMGEKEEQGVKEREENKKPRVIFRGFGGDKGYGREEKGSGKGVIFRNK